jgi:cytochrome c biogenesis protein CcdA
MEWLQQLMDNSTTPVVTAFVLGLVTALSPCPLTMNIAAIGYIGKQIESRKIVFINGLLYTLGRTIAYTLLGLVLIILLRSGASVFGVQKFIATYG